MSKIWDQNLKKLCQFKTKYGNTNVPKSYIDKKLARLVTTLRQQKRYATLKPERELALLQIGFNFEPLESQWLTTYNKLIEYYKMNGHVSLDRRSNNKHERTLADWVHRMHKLIRSNELSEEKVQQLKLINIDGAPSDYQLSANGLPHNFEYMLGRLKIQIKNHGSIIHSNMADHSLYKWVLFQQKRINKSFITPKEYASLLKTGFSIKKESTPISVNTKKLG